MTKTLKFADIEVPVPGFGAMGMSAFYSTSTRNDVESKKTLKRAVELGCTFWDTAAVYGGGRNEKLIGETLKEIGGRDKVFVATKFGVPYDPETGKFTGEPPRGDRAYVNESIELAIQRLGFTPDLFYQHRMDPKTPIEETMAALEDLRKQGKFKYIGLSECSAATLRKACKVAQVHAVQLEVSPWTMDIFTNGLYETCQELNVAIIAYSPLGRGFLTGKYQSPDDFEADDFRRIAPRFSKENFASNLRIVDELNSLAKKKNATSGQLCLAWCIKLGMIPIPGTRSIKYLEENFASNAIDLSDEDMEEINHVIKESDVSGSRYPEAMMHMVHV